MDLLGPPVTRARRRSPEAVRPGASAPDGSTSRAFEPHVGDTVVAQDGTVGEVESVIRTETRAPVYVVVVVRRLVGRRYPVVPWSLVAGVDRTRQRVQVRGRCKSISSLSETVPLVV